MARPHALSIRGVHARSTRFLVIRAENFIITRRSELKVYGSFIVLALFLEQEREVVDGHERVWMRIAELATPTIKRLAVQPLGVGVLALSVEQEREVVDVYFHACDTNTVASCT